MKWIIQNWAKFGGLVAVGIIIYVFVTDLKLIDIKSLLWLHFATLLIHQFEEYVYPGGFKNFFNKNIYNKNRIIRFPLNDTGILFVNVVIAWTAYLTSAIQGYESSYLAIGLLGVTILNGIMHTFMFIIKKKYNPGFISGLFLMIPFGTYVLLRFLTFISMDEFNSGLVVFIIGVGLIPLSIFITNVLRLKEP